MSEKYNDVLLPFLSLMRRELHANAGKGDRPGWLAMRPDEALLEVYYHLSKLQKAVKHNDGPAIMEYSADVANMAMMVLDICGGLAFGMPIAPPADVSNTPPERDIVLPDGSVRHNVGSDNLSDEDRQAMALTDEQVALLNAELPCGHMLRGVRKIYCERCQRAATGSTHG